MRRSCYRILTSCILLLLLSTFVQGKVSAFRKKDLPNGLKLVTKVLPDTESVTARIIVPAGFLDEPPAFRGGSHLLEHMIFRGNDRLCLSDFSGLMDEQGNIFNGFTTLNRTEYYLESSPETFFPSFRLFLDLILRPGLRPEDLILEKMIVSVENVIRTYPGNTFYLYLNHLTQNQLVSSVHSITRDDLLAFHQRFYRPELLTVVITGNFKVQEVQDYLKIFPIESRKKEIIDHQLLLPAFNKEIVIEDYLWGEEYQVLFGFELKKPNAKELRIAKTLPLILEYESKQYDYINKRPIDYQISLLHLSGKYYLVFQYRGTGEKYSPELDNWHKKNLNRYFQYLQTKNFSKFISSVKKSLLNEVQLIESDPARASEFYANQLFEPAALTTEDISKFDQLMVKDFKNFVQKYLAGKEYLKIIVKAL